MSPKDFVYVVTAMDLFKFACVYGQFRTACEKARELAGRYGSVFVVLQAKPWMLGMEGDAELDSWVPVWITTSKEIPSVPAPFPQWEFVKGMARQFNTTKDVEAFLQEKMRK